MALLPSIIAQLPLLQWRNLPPPPYDVVGFEWQNELAPRAVPYVDVEGHDDVRRKSADFHSRLYFCETVQRGAFIDLWPKWLAAIKDGSPDFLVHPLLGTVRARVKSVGGELKARTTDGVIVDVSWVETNDDFSTVSGDLTSESSITNAAQLADSNSAAVDVHYPDGSFDKSIMGAWESIRGTLFSFKLTAFGAVTTLIANVSTMIGEVEDLNTHESWAAHDALVNVWAALTDLKLKLAASARSTAKKKLSADTTLDSFAQQVGNSLQDVMGLNIQALRTPFVPRGSVLSYYTAS